ncbi:transmembrane amino acid transporter protein-domain-containing protein [Mycotypha africana]|uniref:transmembrane amino acid transporter protein-domain-containing protein n=1 Tax=Mycotypha africana TaxID=64632 RepID=UPI0023002B74|nr:transmembrane amino acid transporter protein-domain-containing protein [Mycotypha africana]KAI8991257.1 transmembrane amino acid transporter protein-domain-containing protein [Mycotypha africana]
MSTVNNNTYGSIHSSSSPPFVKSHQLQHVLTNAERDLLQADRPGYGTRTKIEVGFNLVNATVGAGIIGLPFAIARAGFFVGIFVSILVAALAQMGLFMLIVAGQRVQIYKLAMLVEYLLGRWGYHFTNFVICVQAGGAAVSYFILLGDSLPMLLERYLPDYPLLASRTFILIFVGTVCIFPLAIPRSIGSLARWSIVSVACLPVILLMILVRAPAYIPKDQTVPIEWAGDDIFGALGIMAFAFTCHQVALSNFLTLRNQTTSSWRFTTILSTGISWVISMTFAVVGYLCFGSNVQSNLFNNFASDDPFINVGRLALAISMILTIPTAIFPTREAIQKSLGFETATKQPTNTQHYAVTIILFAVVLSLAVSIRSLGTVYSIAGGFSATSLAYILPAVCYLTTRQIYFKNQEKYYSQISPSSSASIPNNIATVFPTLTGTSTLIAVPDESDLKTAAMAWDETNSIASSSNNKLFEDDLSTVDGDAYLVNEEATADFARMMDDKALKPTWWLDIAAGLLIIWGFVVMFCSLSSVFKSQH